MKNKTRILILAMIAAFAFDAAVPQASVMTVRAADEDDTDDSSWDDDADDDDDTEEDDTDEDDEDDGGYYDVGDEVTSKGYTYEILTVDDDTEKGKVALKETDSRRIKTLSVPKTIKDDTYVFTVTAVSDEAFEDYSHLVSVTLPDTVTKIGESAFENCSVLKNVTTGKNLTKIGKQAFYGDKSVKQFVIRSRKISSFGKEAFAAGNKKCTVKVPAAVLKTYQKKLIKAGLAKTAKVKK